MTGERDPETRSLRRPGDQEEGEEEALEEAGEEERLEVLKETI